MRRHGSRGGERRRLKRARDDYDGGGTEEMLWRGGEQCSSHDTEAAEKTQRWCGGDFISLSAEEEEEAR